MLIPIQTKHHCIKGLIHFVGPYAGTVPTTSQVGMLLQAVRGAGPQQTSEAGSPSERNLSFQ